ncbi:MAG: PKD domain-containing protein [Thermoplasmata archaeon]|nr:PKD domain-containing protein [Thermoplasmata archaeon]
MEVTVRDITDPVPNAGSDRTVDQNTTVVLDGSRSNDNVAIASWTWTFVYDGAQKELVGQDTEFYFVTPGEYQVTLRVTDRAGNAASTSITITVKDTIDPVAVTPKDREAEVDQRLVFDGSSSSDNVGIVNYTWIVERPTGKVIELYGETVEYVPKEPGDHEVTLVVSDADGNSVVSDPFTVHVPNVQLWMTLLIIVVGSIAATAAVALYTRRKTRRMDQQRRGGG